MLLWLCAVGWGSLLDCPHVPEVVRDLLIQCYGRLSCGRRRRASSIIQLNLQDQSAFPNLSQAWPALTQAITAAMICKSTVQGRTRISPSWLTITRCLQAQPTFTFPQ